MTVTSRVFASLAPVVVLLACAPDSNEGPTVFGSGINAQAFSADRTPWSAPMNLGAPVNLAGVTTTSPMLSHDGLSLYFSANRPGGTGLPAGNNIWVSHRASLDSPWETPVNLGPPINDPTASLPVLSVDGHLLLFTAARTGCPNVGGTCLWLSHRTDTHDDFAWEAPVPLGPDVNAAGFVAAPSYMQTADAGRTNLYFSRGPVGTDLDIYSVAINRDGETVGPVTLVSELSSPSPFSDAHPSLRVDGKEVYFYSTRLGGLGSQDLWMSTRQNDASPWSTPENVGAPINTSGVDIHPSLSFDGRTLMWSSNRPGTVGVRDIWMATRTPSGK
jgi:hypothetical protein